MYHCVLRTLLLAPLVGKERSVWFWADSDQGGWDSDRVQGPTHGKNQKPHGILMVPKKGVFLGVFWAILGF